MKRLALLLALAIAASAPAATTKNDNSCDIALQPAATLLLPYFEVNLDSPPQIATQTIFTIQNTSSIPQIARVTLWTDWAYPAYSFPVFLAGYDVQGFSLYDILNGRVVQTSIDAAPPPFNAVPGAQPAANDANPNFLPDARTGCLNVPAPLSPAMVAELQRMFTIGKTALGCQVGSPHAWAIGYVTIDVVATCAPKNPTYPGYFSILLYDNVLTGDYQQIVPRAEKSYAQGSPLVHIRAIPEGGPAGAVTATSLPYTFYDRLTTHETSRTVDRRQPLPSVFAPRLIAGGTNSLNTTLKIWREGVTPADATCNQYVSNNNLAIADTVRFDEHENATATAYSCNTLCPPPPGTNAAFTAPANSSWFPPISTSGDAGGWLYFNLANGGSANYSTSRPGYAPRGRASQGWVITSMFAEPTYATETTAIALGNGCTPRVDPYLPGQIGPAPNPTP
jgi:hypothetical protein